MITPQLSVPLTPAVQRQNSRVEGSCLFHSLGIALLLPRSPTDPVQITNTEQRKKELAETCLRLLRLRHGKVSPHECSVFAGRLRWLEGQTCGRLGRKFFRTVLSAGEPLSDFRRTKLSPALQDAFEWILSNVPKAPPKCFWQPCGKTFQLFTDGSFENGKGCMAGVLCRGSGHPWQYWRACVPQGACAQVASGWGRAPHHAVRIAGSSNIPQPFGGLSFHHHSSPCGLTTMLRVSPS